MAIVSCYEQGARHVKIDGKINRRGPAAHIGKCATLEGLFVIFIIPISLSDMLLALGGRQ